MKKDPTEERKRMSPVLALKDGDMNLSISKSIYTHQIINHHHHQLKSLPQSKSLRALVSVQKIN